MKLFQVLLPVLLVLSSALAEDTEGANTPKPSMARTAIKVSRSLNPEDMQTLNVMTKDGNVAQLIVKRRDPKAKITNLASPNPEGSSRRIQGSSQYSRAIYTNWVPVSSLYYHPNIIRLDTIAVVRNATQEKPNVPNVIDSDRIPNVPRPVTIRSGDIFVKSVNDKKRGRSVVQVDKDGIPVVHGVRVRGNDPSDRQTWRNARVINGELVPYEQGYQPPPVVPVGELIYASQAQEEQALNLNKEVGGGPDNYRSIGPFTTQDNFRQEEPPKKQGPFGPFTVQDNIGGEAVTDRRPGEPKSDFVRFGAGPFTKEDNAKYANSRLMDYISEINAKEAQRDYFNRRKYRSYDTINADPSQQMQRRMLTYPGQPSYPNSLLYTPSKLSPVTFNEGVRTPVLQYAHPELGVQPAKATPEEEEEQEVLQDSSYDSNSYDSNPQYPEVDSGRQQSSSPSQYYTNNLDNYYTNRKDVMNYPYNTYYVKSKPEQPFWFRITETIKDNVQNGFARMQQLTRPVFEPLMEATHKISHNLGFSKQPLQRAQDKMDLIAAPVGSSVLLPALGLVAGGAALGLGAAAVGRFLNPNDMRAFNPNDNIVLIMEEPPRQQAEEHKRFRRNSEDEFYIQQIVSNVEKESALSGLSAPHFWSDTPCAKRLFCEVMMGQNNDEVVFMEKKMHSLLSAIHPEVAKTVAHHLQEVMDAVKFRECSKFRCTRRFPIPAPVA